MAFTFPRALPSPNKISQIGFIPSDQQSKSTTRGGSHQVVDLAPVIWLADVSTSWLNEEQWGAWEGWLDTMRGGLNSFYLHRVGRRSMPLKYPDGFGGALRAVGGAFDGTALLESVSVTDFHEISLENLPQTFILSIGDFLAFDYNGNRAFHRVTQGSTSDALGKSTVMVHPYVRPGVLAGAVVQLVKPAAQMMLVPGSISFGKITVDGGQQKIRFKAQQIVVNS